MQRALRVSLFSSALALMGAFALATAPDADAQRRTQPVEVTMVQNEGRSVSVQGEGVVRVAPDRATASIVFRQRAESLMDAHNMVQRDLQRLVDAVAAAGYERGVVRSGALHYNPEYSYEQGRAPQLVGYHAQMTVIVRIENMDDLPRLMELAMSSGAFEIHPVEYGVSNLAEKRKEARALAMKAARERAEELASGFDAEVGHVLQIAESEGYVQPMPRGRMMMAEMAMADGSGDSFAKLDPDELEVRVIVSASFSLR